VLTTSGKAMQILLFKRLLDLTLADDKAERNMWLKVEDGCAPLAAEDSGVSCFSFMLENPSKSPGPKERLRIMAPIPEDFDRNDLESITEFPVPESLYIERIRLAKNGQAETMGRYLVSRKVSYAYDPDATPETIMDTDFGVDNIDTERMPAELAQLGMLLIHMARWKARPQRRKSRGGQLIEL
jgi:hypothetical protein